MNKKLIRKMQTAAGGPLRIKFTPEQIALFENRATRVPGMNNSGGDKYRKEGVLALQHLEQEAKRKEEEIKSRMEIRPTLKRRATTAEKLQGKKDEYEQVPLVVGMSGTDPVGEFILAGIGFNGIGALAKTGLWNVAKYAPTTLLGNWGRGYFVGNAFKNSFNGIVPKSVIIPLTRTKVGDVEIDNPNLLYHLDRGNSAGAFSNQGAYVENGVLFPGAAKKEGLLSYSWWNEGKPYATSINGQHMTRLMTVIKDTPGMLLVRNQNYPIGQWTGNKGFVLPSEYVNSEGVNVSGSLYNWKPVYGYKKIIQEPSTSLKFFERPSKISEAEKLGLPKGERNNVLPFRVANYPGYLLKGLMKGSPLEKQLSKNGTININLLNAYFNKASQLEREVANKVLAEKFAELKTIDYNLFKKAVLDELINYSTKPQMRYSTYGMDRLGFNVIKESDGAGGIVEYLPGIRTNTFTFESPRILQGSNKHYDYGTLGHSRTYTTPEEPKILHVMESLSDWGQSHVKMMPSVLAHQVAIEKALKSGNINAFHSFTNRLYSLMRDKLTKYERMALENINKEIESGLPSGFLTVEDLWNKKYEILKKASNRSNIGVLGLHLHDNYLQRQLQENLRYAAENGLTKMRYPTSETAAKIEGYSKQSPNNVNENIIEQFWKDNKELQEINWRDYYNGNINSLSDYIIKTVGLNKYNEFLDKIGNATYSPQHQTILKKYTDFPKLFKKLYKDLNVRMTTDAKGNTWYEVDVPKGYLNREWQFKKGGKMNIIEFLKNGSGIHIKKKNRGKFTSYCGGKVTDECILRGKNSSNPAIRKRATFALNARRWKHQEGGTIINGSPIVTLHLLWLQNMPDYLAKKEELKKQKLLLEFLEALLKQDFFGNLLGTAGNFLLNYISKPKNDKDIQQSNSI